MELKNQNGQMLLVEYTREEFITLLKLMKFAETAREVVDHSLVSMDIALHQVDALMDRCKAIASDVKIKVR